jgi:coproporphyrinogen III oxidase
MAIQKIGDDFDALIGKQKDLARRMTDYMDETNAKVARLVEGFNGTSTPEIKNFHYDDADYDVSVWRGSVIEKLGWMTSISRQGVPGRTPTPLWNRYMEVDVHPKTPLVGQFHATIYFGYFVDGTDRIAGYMDYTPAAWINEDNQALKETLDRIFERYGMDIMPYRGMLELPYHKDKLKAAAVGVGLYTKPTLNVTHQNMDLVTEVYSSFVDAYFDMLDARKDQAFSNSDVDAQDGMRKRWLEDHLFSDPITMHVVPFEVWAFCDQAPMVKF